MTVAGATQLITLGRGVAAWALIVLSAEIAFAQSASFRGRVIIDSTEVPLVGVVVSIPELKLETSTDSLGNYWIPRFPPGAYTVFVRKIGFAPVTSLVEFAAGEFETVLVLTRTAAQALPDVKIETKALLHGKLAEFQERRLAGQGGRFLTQADLEKHSLGRMSDALRTMPGIEFRQNPGLSNEVYAVGGRSSVPGRSLSRNAPSTPCPAAVVVDGSFVYHGEGPLFNLNSINPTDIAGIEFYAGASSMPIKYNGTRNTCGLLLIWTK